MEKNKRVVMHVRLTGNLKEPARLKSKLACTVLNKG